MNVPTVDKAAVTLQTVAAMAGFRVDPIEADDGSTAYIVSRWAMAKQCNSLDEVRALLKRMGIES